jgi:hypothetical protein
LFDENGNFGATDVSFTQLYASNIKDVVHLVEQLNQMKVSVKNKILPREKNNFSSKRNTNKQMRK